MRLIAPEFDSYLKAIYPGMQVSHHQKTEVRRAFYAGVATFMALASGDFSKSVPEDIFLAKMRSELEEFNEDVRRGRA